MNINVHVELLILDGLPVSTSQASLVQAALETELMRLFAEQGLRSSSAGVVPHVAAGSIQLTEHSKPAQLGSQIAQTLHSSLAPVPAPPRQTRSTRGAPA
jgi:hypothetical protein